MALHDPGNGGAYAPYSPWFQEEISPTGKLIIPDRLRDHAVGAEGSFRFCEGGRRRAAGNITATPAAPDENAAAAPYELALKTGNAKERFRSAMAEFDVVSKGHLPAFKIRIPR